MKFIKRIIVGAWWGVIGTTEAAEGTIQPGENFTRAIRPQPHPDWVAMDNGAGFCDWIPPEPGPEAASMTPKEFMERFTIEELLAIETRAATTPAVRLWIDRLTAAGVVVFDDPSLLEGLAFMVYEGLITQTRHDQILGGE